MGGEPGNGGHGVGFVGGLEQKDAARFEDTGDVAEDGERVGQVFEDVVGENPIEGSVGIGDAAGVGVAVMNRSNLQGPKVPFDALKIDHRNLDVITPAKTRTLVKEFIFRERRTYRIIGG